MAILKKDISFRSAMVAALAACLIFLLQATPFLYTRWVEDESWYGSIAYSLATEGRLRNPVFPETDIESRVDTRPPAMPLSLAASIKVFGTGPEQFRIPSVLAGLGVVIGVFLLGLELTNPTIAAIAALLAATDNFLFVTSRTVRPDIYVACFGTIAAWLFFRARRKNSWLLALLSSLAIGIAINFHPNGIAIAGALGLLLLFEFRGRVFRAPRFRAFVLGIALSAAPFTIWIVSDPVHLQAFKRLWGRGSSSTYASLMAQEKARYADFIGVGSQRIPLPVQAPTRIHIAAALAIAALLLARYNRALLGRLAVLTIPSLLMWVTEVNPTSRFFVIVAPYFTLMLVAGAFYFANTVLRRRIAAAVLIMIALTQIGGNVFMLHRSRSADYSALTANLRRIIPGKAQTYGAMTFWLALHDSRYYAYNRTPLDYALRHGATYLILNDRVMMHGTGYGANFFEPLREELNAFARSHAEIAGHINDPFYGDLEIYRVQPAAFGTRGEPVSGTGAPE